MTARRRKAIEGLGLIKTGVAMMALGGIGLAILGCAQAQVTGSPGFAAALLVIAGWGMLVVGGFMERLREQRRKKRR